MAGFEKEKKMRAGERISAPRPKKPITYAEYLKKAGYKPSFIKQNRLIRERKR